MTESDYQLEQDLRAQTREKGARVAASILADFYEQHGQPSRGALWRRDMRVHAQRKHPADLVVQDSNWRRKVAMWLAGHMTSQAIVGRHFRSSASWTRTLIHEVECKICEAANAERHWPTMVATQRLQAVGALPPQFDRGVFELGEAPPESWPITVAKSRKPQPSPAQET
jgi:hypothetical protein